MARKKPNKRTMRRRLDNVVRDYIKLLYNNICQTCFIHRDSTPLCSLDWSHYISRRYTIVRWMPENSLPMCRKCHQAYGDGFNSSMIESINRIHGEGTTNKLEKMAMQYPTIKGTKLDSVDFRLELEKEFKGLIKDLESGTSNQGNRDSVIPEERWGIIISEDKEIISD